MREKPRSGVRWWVLAEPLDWYLHRYPLLIFAVLFLVGMKVGGLFAPAGMIYCILFLLVAGLTAAVLYVGRSKSVPASAVALLAVLPLGGLYRVVSHPRDGDALSVLAGVDWQPCAVIVEIKSAAVWQPASGYAGKGQPEWRTTWDVQCEAIRDGNTWIPVKAVACTLSTGGRIDQLVPGDRLQVACHFRRILSSANPGGFDFAEASRRQGRFVSLMADHPDQLQLLSRSWARRPLAWARAIAIREIDRCLQQWIPLGQAPLAAALVFGQREQVDWDEQQTMMATGTLHMLSISGLHVEIVAAIVFMICSFANVSNRTMFFCLMLIAWSYAFLAGSQPPVIRAAVQVSAFAYARWVGGRARLGNLLGLAAIVLALWHASNIDNIGVQLSFLAVAAIGMFAVYENKEMRRRARLQAVLDAAAPAWWNGFKAVLSRLRMAGLLCCWVSLLTCPMIWNNFHVISPISIPLNMAISLPLSVSLISGLMAGLLAWMPPIAAGAGTVCGAGLKLIVEIVNWGAEVPGGHFWLPAPAAWWSIGFYVITLVWLVIFGAHRKLQLALVLMLWIVVGMSPWLQGPKGIVYRGHTIDRDASEGELRCTFLSVGHGTCVIIELPGGEVWLYDAGHLGASERSHQEIAAALWSLGTCRISRLWISHADSDHYNATQGLMDRFFINRIVGSSHFFASNEEDLIDVLARSKRRGVLLESVSAPQHFSAGGCQFQLLHPSQAWNGATDNANSLCLLVEYAGKRILLPGDMEGAGLVSLVELPARPCHILMAPHHGSTTLDPVPLLDWCQPDFVLISGNQRAVRREVLERYERETHRVAVTHREGAVQFRISAAGSIAVWHWAGQGWQAW